MNSAVLKNSAAHLVAPAAVFNAFAQARSIALSAYTLAPGGAATRALEAAADRGAAVSVTLENFAAVRQPDSRAGPDGRREPVGPWEPEGRWGSDDLRRDTARVAAELRRHGVAVKLGVPSGTEVHIKAAVADETAFLADRNWTSTGETVLATTQPDDVAAVRAAIDGRFSTTADLATEKRAALALEVETIRNGTGDRVDLESESFGAGSVCAALRRRAEAGAHVRLLVSGRIAYASGATTERAVLRGLVASGIEIRTTEANEKLCVAGAAGWVGSANATYEYAPTSDWGYQFRNSPAIASLESAFEHSWKTARPFKL